MLNKLAPNSTTKPLTIVANPLQHEATNKHQTVTVITQTN